MCWELVRCVVNIGTCHRASRPGAQDPGDGKKELTYRFSSDLYKTVMMMMVFVPGEVEHS